MGLGLKQSSNVISLKSEEKLFECGELGEGNPQQLLNTVVYMVGLHFALRGGVEHQRLRRPGFNSQINFEKDDHGVERVTYREDPLQKTFQGGLGCNLNRKVVQVYPSENKSRCPVRLIKKYCSLLPPPKTCQKFYLQPRPKFNPKVWFCDQPYGNHKVSSTIKLMCKKAGLVGKYTNHSLRASSASRMYESEIPEQVIKEITGHRSECVRTYKRTPDSIKQKASVTISGGTVIDSRNVGKKVCDEIECVEDVKVEEKNMEIGEETKQRLEESLTACKIIKNVIKTRMELRKKQGDKDKLGKRRMAQKLVKKQKKSNRKKVSVRGGKQNVVIDVNLNVKMVK